MRPTVGEEEDLYRTSVTRTAAVALFSVAAVLLPRTESIRWPAAAAAVGLLVASGIVPFVTLNRWRPDAWPWWVSLAQLTLALSGAGFAGAAVGGPEGSQRFLLLLILVVSASYSPAPIVAIGWALATVTVSWSAVLGGTPVDIAFTVTVMFGASAAAVASVIHLLLNRIRRQNHHAHLIAGLASEIAQADSVDDDLPAVLALTSEVLAGSGVRLSRRGIDGGVVALGAHTPERASRRRRGRDLSFDEEMLVTAVDGVPYVLSVHWSSAAVRRSVARQTVTTVRDLLGHLIDRSQVIERLEHRTRTDPLTALGNRRALSEWLLERAGYATVVIFDLDHFKAFNDAHGHVAGDVLLQRFATVLRDHLRQGDCATRLGGEEFCVALATLNAEVAESYVVRIRDAMAADSSGVTFSAGIAVTAFDEPAELLLARADTALYAAKRAGRNRTARAPAEPASHD